MDQPTVSSEAPDRAVSSEPSSTRPNPFTEGDDSSRKRRRTSLSGGSRSLSVESTKSGLDMSSSPNAERPDDTSTQHSVMKIDTAPSTPRTPEMQSTTTREPPTEPPSSRVTINLRNAAQPDALSSPPVSPTPRTIPDRPTEPSENVKKSVEDLEEVDMAQAPIEITDTPPSTSSSIRSPEVEFIAIPDDEQDAPFDDEVSIIREDVAFIDPIHHFPWNEPHVPVTETLNKLVHYLSPTRLEAPAEENVIDSLRTWMLSYVHYVGNVGLKASYESHLIFHNFWNTFPEIAWLLAKHPISRDSRRSVVDFFSVYARLASCFVEFDFLTAQALQAAPEIERRQPNYLLGRYLTALIAFVRHDSRAQNGQLHDEDVLWTRPSDAVAILDIFQSGSGSLKALNKLTQTHLSNASNYHHLMDVLAPICNTVALILQKTWQAVGDQSSFETMEIVNMRLADGYLHFNLVSGALAMTIEKTVTQLSNDITQQLITSLSEILKISLSGDHKLAAEHLKAHRQTYPGLPRRFTQEAIWQEWRLGVYEKLVTSGPMQLRVMSATALCSDLVNFFKDYSDQDDEHTKFLTHAAEYLLGTRLVDYVLGPTCHPEITVESGNIVGFLIVTRFYRKEHTDMLWQTITTTQDPRVSEALIRMTTNIVGLFSKDELLYLCEKLQGLPIDSFTPHVRGFCDRVLHKLPSTSESQSMLPFALIIRLLRESSIYQADSLVAHPEVRQFALNKFRDLVRDGLEPEIRKELYVDCLGDIAAKSPTTLGTLSCLSLALRPAMASEVRVLAAEHDLASLLVDEFEHAIEQGKQVGITKILGGPVNFHRRDLIACVLTHEPTTITTDLGLRLWDMLVGHAAASQDDRDNGWQILNAIPRTAFGNPFLSSCFVDYLPSLPRDCLCGGALEFIKGAVLPRVNDINDIILDDDDSLAQSGVEQLWRMILDADSSTLVAKDAAAKSATLVDAAIQTLVDDIYIDSKSILAYPHHRACQVHLGLVNRCLGQMEGAAKCLESFNDGTRSGDDEPMVIVATEEQSLKQERIFIRSLAVLRHFLNAHQAKAHFSAPDLRALTPGSPSVTEGESAELKLQSFDGNKQTDIIPLEVGRQNTAGSLLASIRQATGFDNYRIYYRGHPFAPKESDVCRSLEDLKIHDGLILVKRAETGTAAASRVKPGASLLQIEILGHFEQLWSYLSMQNVLAGEIHSFLTKLPTDTHMLAAFDSPDTSYQQVFPAGQPFKSLYALYAMKDFIDTAARRLKDSESVVSDGDDPRVKAYLDALFRVRKLVVAAISDGEVLGSCTTEVLKNRLAFNLMNIYGLTFRGMFRLVAYPMYSDSVADPGLDGLEIRPRAAAIAPADRLVDILTWAISTPSKNNWVYLISSTFSAILRSACIDSDFWNSLRSLPNFEELIGVLLLDEPSEAIRTNIAKLIEERIISSYEFVFLLRRRLPVTHANFRVTANTTSFCEFLWPILCRLLPKAAQFPTQCQQVFGLTLALFREMSSNDMTVLDVPALANECGELLLGHESSEQFGHNVTEDAVASGLVQLLHSCLTERSDVDVEKDLPVPEVAELTIKCRRLARRLFWAHLFPPPRQPGTKSDRSCLLSTRTRAALTEVIFELVKDRDHEFNGLLEDLESLVPFDEFEIDPYLYELQPQFDRMSAVRAPCGYAGLRNLSNTCYLNSLFTQLFMNTGFRRFMMNARVPDLGNSHALLKETRKLFAFMQESSRKFIDPSLLVGSIKTYEETMIDVHNQMDVDEFYNLLFDRWEGQLSSAEDRKTLRSFYGGQLVQQVASKECEHISERLEPFSAIQCDIKGKSTLQDSLQAYVDGEIMEGVFELRPPRRCRQKVRISDGTDSGMLLTCCRACLKDIPDNLIFHLKRFDFNLRTLMRSKINDYFSFPTKIDMRPYTIDHLGSPSYSEEEDTFELVGVLVHAGTAESGHYYSYIRERPTTESSEPWFEFNDDLVSPWNPAKMEESTFGGADGPSESSIVYDKTYSAYMLFYQRSSVLKAEQEKLQSLSLSTPLKVDVPDEVADHIAGENTVLLRRHCLYDPSHSSFVLKIFHHARMRYGGKCSDTHLAEQHAMHMLLGHLDQVASRTKELPDFDLFQEAIENAILNCAKCAMDFFEYFQERHEAFRQLLQRNPDPHVRYSIGSLFITSLRRIKDTQPELWNLSQADMVDEPVMMQAVQMLETLWNNFHVNLRSWHEVFQTILSFAKMGSLETALLFSEDWFVKVLRIVFADTNLELTNNYARMLTNVIRRMNNTRSTSYEMIIQLIDHFMDSLEDILDVSTIVESAETRLEMYMEQQVEKLPWAPDEVTIFCHEWSKGTGSTFVKKLIDLDQEPVHTASIVKRMIHLNHDMDQRVFFAIKSMITGQAVQYSVTPYIRAAVLFSQESRSAACIQNLFRHMALQCRALQNTDGRAFFDFFRLAYFSIQNESEEIRSARYPLYVEHIHVWAPSLLGYFDAEVRQDAEDFLSTWLANTQLVETTDEKLAVLLNVAARKLAMSCLVYLRDNFVQRRAQVAKQSTESLNNIIMKCETFFRIDAGVEAERVITYTGFQELYSAIMEPLQRMTVEELEDEGSGMSPGFYSDSDTIASEP
ncbi:Ubiquitin carboxyl-terminal hydrolase 34 [Colletotrichum chlorophyti]|uniref:Ubiquitin carboxyl-terminal hydrolase 34 n=1 Tax=Colletotrichum chlorophyti TaxID=708187 RepID=A0A1Q8S0D0_9PEZI|nr:Ubiquitin carboxyl-terminal hydrolase 34 [Colletotrichum chlorophyti]